MNVDLQVLSSLLTTISIFSYWAWRAYVATKARFEVLEDIYDSVNQDDNEDPLNVKSLIRKAYEESKNSFLPFKILYFVLFKKEKVYNNKELSLLKYEIETLILLSKILSTNISLSPISSFIVQKILSIFGYFPQEQSYEKFLIEYLVFSYNKGKLNEDISVNLKDILRKYNIKLSFSSEIDELVLISRKGDKEQIVLKEGEDFKTNRFLIALGMGYLFSENIKGDFEKSIHHIEHSPWENHEAYLFAYALLMPADNVNYLIMKWNVTSIFGLAERFKVHPYFMNIRLINLGIKKIV